MIPHKNNIYLQVFSFPYFLHHIYIIMDDNRNGKKIEMTKKKKRKKY